MKLKSDRKIDLFLFDNGFKYILEYLDHKKIGADPFMLSAIDVLRMTPDFEVEIKIIRDKNHINWIENINKVEAAVGKENYKKFLCDLYKIVTLKYVPLNSNFNKVYTYFMNYSNRYHSDISKYINHIKDNIITKIQPAWRKDIEIYILFNVCWYTPFVFRRQIPLIRVLRDKKTKERYIEIKVFSDSNLSIFNETRCRKLLSDVFLDRIWQERYDDDNNLRRFLHYVLKIRGKFRHKDIYQWLSDKGFAFGDSDYSHASQEVKRFEQMIGLKK